MAGRQEAAASLCAAAATAALTVSLLRRVRQRQKDNKEATALIAQLSLKLDGGLVVTNAKGGLRGQSPGEIRPQGVRCVTGYAPGRATPHPTLQERDATVSDRLRATQNAEARASKGLRQPYNSSMKGSPDQGRLHAAGSRLWQK